MRVSFPFQSILIVAGMNLVIDPDNEFMAKDDIPCMDDMEEEEYDKKTIVLAKKGGENTRQKSLGGEEC